MNRIVIKALLDEVTETVTYIVIDPASQQAAVIDPVLDFDWGSGSLSTRNADRIIRFLDENRLQLEWILETKAHLDHLTAAGYLKEQRGGQIGISEHITQVQSDFSKTFNLQDDMPCDGSEFDYLFRDGEIVLLGHLEVEVIDTPGNMPACLCYKIEDAVFVGDILRMPETGTARTGFPSTSESSNAKALDLSIQRILSLPETTRIFVGHNGGSQSQKQDQEHLACETTVLQEKRDNTHQRSAVTEAAHAAQREHQDQSLSSLGLQLPSIQVNMRAGKLPEKESNGIRYLKVPLSVESA